MPYIQVDVDLDDIDTCDLADELASRLKIAIKRAKHQQKFDEVKELLSECEQLVCAANATKIGFPIQSLEDKMKIEHLQEVWNKYSLSQIQSILA